MWVVRPYLKVSLANLANYLPTMHSKRGVLGGSFIQATGMAEFEDVGKQNYFTKFQTIKRIDVQLLSRWKDWTGLNLGMFFLLPGGETIKDTFKLLW